MTGRVDGVVDLSDAHDRIGVGVEYNLGCVVALLVELMQNAHELERVMGVGEVVGGIEIQEVNACVDQQLNVLAHDVFVVDVVVAVKRFAPVVPIVHLTPKGIVDVARRCTGLINDLLHIELACVAVLSVPQKIEDTNVVILGHNANLACVIERSVKIVRACITAEQIDIVVGNGVGNGVLTLAVSNGGILPVSGIGDIQRACIVVVVRGGIVHKFGIGPFGLGQGRALHRFLFLPDQIIVITRKVKRLGICFGGKHGKIANVDGVALMHTGMLVQRVKTELREADVRQVCPAVTAQNQRLPLTVGFPSPFQVGVGLLREGNAVVTCNVDLTHVLGGGAVLNADVSRLAGLDARIIQIESRVVCKCGEGAVFAFLDLILQVARARKGRQNVGVCKVVNVGGNGNVLCCCGECEWYAQHKRKREKQGDESCFHKRPPSM